MIRAVPRERARRNTPVLTPLAALAASAALLATGMAPPALAQNGPSNAIPPIHGGVDRNGVDLFSGTVTVSSPSVSIGGGGGGLSYSQLIYGGAWRHSVMGTVNVSGSTYIVSVGGSSESFTLNGGTYTPDQATGSILTYDSGTDVYTYYTRDGSIAKFETACSIHLPLYANEACLTNLTTITGESIDLHYQVVTSYDGSFPSPLEVDEDRQVHRLQSVTSNRGYQLHFDYYDISGNPPFAILDSQIDEFAELESVTAINNAVERCLPLVDGCSLANDWPILEIHHGTNQHTYEDLDGNQTVFYYSTGGLSGIRWPGTTTNDISYGYSSGRVVSATDAGSNQWIYASSDIGGVRTVTVTDPLTQDVEIAFSVSSGTLSSYTDQLNKTTEYSYDSNNRLTQITFPEGNRRTYSYDARGNLTETRLIAKAFTGIPDLVTSATYATTTCTTSNMRICNRLLTTTDAGGNITHYTWDTDFYIPGSSPPQANPQYGFLQQVQSPSPNGGTAPRPTVRYEFGTRWAGFYDPSTGNTVNGSAIQVLMRVRSCAQGTYDAGNENCDVASPGTDVEETVRETIYESSGGHNNILPIQTRACTGDNNSTGPLGYTQDIICESTDSDAFLSTSYFGGQSGTPALFAMSSTTWNRFGDPVTVDGPLSGTADTTAVFYDDIRRVIGVIGPDPDGGSSRLRNAIRYTYDSRGRTELVESGTATAQTLAGLTGMTVLARGETDFDVLSRPTHQRYVTPESTSPYANITRTLTQFSYDALSRPVCVAQRMDSSSNFSSSPTNPCVVDTSPGSYGDDRITHYTYTDRGQVASVTSGYDTAAAITVNYSYWDNGTLATVEDGEDSRMLYSYDGLDRPLFIVFPHPSTPSTSNFSDYIHFAYADDADGSGNRMTDGTGHGGLEVLTNRWGYGTVFSYDDLGRVTVANRPSGTPDAFYSYDNFSRILSVGDGTRAMAFAYDAFGRMTGRTHSSFTGAMTYEYDAAGRRTRMEWADSGSPYVEYEYDVTGALLAIRENGAPSGAGVLAEFGYNTRNQLVSVERADENGAATSYTYDDAHRLLTLSHDLSGTTNDVTFTYAYNPAGQIISRTISNDAYVFSGFSDVDVSDQINGLNQLTQIGSSGLTHDTAGNITHDTVNTLVYDQENRPVSSTDGVESATFTWNPDGSLYALNDDGTTSYYEHDGANPAARRNSSNAVTERYVHAGGLGAPVAQYEGSGTSTRRWPVTDERGSVLAQTDSSGALVGAINSFDEYGMEPLDTNGDSLNSGTFGYAGQFRLPMDHMTLNRNRVYGAGLGRFMQTDPIGQNGGLNLYSYTGGDPINFTDPWGLDHGGEHVPGDVAICPPENEVPTYMCPFVNIGNDGWGYSYTDDELWWLLNDGFGPNGYGAGPGGDGRNDREMSCSERLAMIPEGFTAYDNGTTEPWLPLPYMRDSNGQLHLTPGHRARLGIRAPGGSAEVNWLGVAGDLLVISYKSTIGAITGAMVGPVGTPAAIASDFDAIFGGSVDTMGEVLGGDSPTVGELMAEMCGE